MLSQRQKQFAPTRSDHGSRAGRSTAMIRNKLSEADIQRTCTDFLKLDGWRPLRTDPCSDKARGKGFGEKGMADHLYIRYGDLQPDRPLCEVMWIEWKSERGRVSPHQIAWREAERARGALTL